MTPPINLLLKKIVFSPRYCIQEHMIGIIQENLKSGEQNTTVVPISYQIQMQNISKQSK